MSKDIEITNNYIEIPIKNLNPGEFVELILYANIFPKKKEKIRTGRIELSFDLKNQTISEVENIKGVIVTSTGHPPHDFVSRFFAPRLGVDEDPVTGAAHTILAPYWAEILGKQEMSVYQASSRGGELTVRVREKNRVDLIGKALIFAKGNLNLSTHTRKMKSQCKNVKINQAF